MPFKFSFLAVSVSLFFSTSFANTTQQSNSTINTMNQSQSMQQSVESQLAQKNVAEDKWSEWGLNREEWSRYEELKQGSRGIWTPNLDPLTMLGVEARTAQERDRIAELLVKKEYARAEKEIAFQIAYTEAFERLYPGQLPFRVDEQGNTTTTVNRIIYFTRTDCGKACDEDLRKLFARHSNTNIDIYIVDSERQDSKIQQWALSHHIDVEKVRRRQITLNHDKNGYFFKYAKGKIPSAFHIQDGGQWQPFIY